MSCILLDFYSLQVALFLPLFSFLDSVKASKFTQLTQQGWMLLLIGVKMFESVPEEDLNVESANRANRSCLNSSYDHKLFQVSLDII